MTTDDKITFFAETDFRNKKTRFGIKTKDRNRHVYVIGKTGMGKSTLLENMAIQDIQNGEGLGIIDPHGGFAEKMLDYVPESRIKDVIYFAPFDTDYPMSFNVMEDVGADKRHLVASSLMSIFKKIWVDAWSARMEYILNNTILALLEYPGSTLLGVNRMFSDKDFRKKVVNNVQDASIKAFWINEFAKYNDKYMQEATIQNKIGQFTANPLIRNIIGQGKSSFNTRSIMDDKKILIMNLSKGRIGETNTALLGGMLITKIYLGAMSRADLTEHQIKQLPAFYLYVDEFQSFANETFANILSEARKYNLNLTIAHQFIEQMTDDVRAAVFGNVGTTITFRVGPFDAEILEKIFAPKFTAEDIVNLSFTQIYLSLMINGAGSQPFSAVTIAPFPRPDISFRELVAKNSREVFAKPKAIVEEVIQAWHDENFAEKKLEKPRDFNNPTIPYAAKFVGKPAFAPKPQFTNRVPEPQRAFKDVFPKKNERIPVYNRGEVKMNPISSHKMETRNTPIKTWKPEPPKLENKSLSPQLKDILNKLESKDSVSVKNPAPISILKTNPKKEEFVHLSSLNTTRPEPIAPKIKEASSSNMDMLRETLKKAMADNKKPASIAPTPKQEIKKPASTESYGAAKAEVPEHILRKILE